MTKSYKFYSDSGHGWLAVKRQELIDLGILDKITHYSYQRGNTVYLEEDCDMTRFTMAKKELKIVEGKYQDRSSIRSYDSFKNV